MSACITASCLAHREEVFWHSFFAQWVHLDCWPCEPLAGWGDPAMLLCRYCGVRVQPDGAGALWSHVPHAPGHWEQADDWRRWVWHDDKWTRKCPVSPTYQHEDRPMNLTRVKPVTMVGA